VQRRILLFVTDLKIGGTPTVVRDIATRLSRGNEAAKARDVVIEVACLDRRGPMADQIKAAGIDVFPLDASGPADVAVVGRLVKLVHTHRIDTVLSFLMHANAAAAAASLVCAGARFIQSIQTTQPTPGWHWSVQSIAQHAAEKILVPSASAADAAAQWAKVPRDKIVVIPNAVDPKDFAGLDEGKPNGKRAGFIGRLDPIKRINDLIDAVAPLPSQFTLDIFGEGSQRQSLEAQIAKLNLNDRVKLHGAVADPREALRKIDLLVLPSAAEGFGLVLIEAMAAGVPVIGTNVPGIRDVVRDSSNGLLVPPSNPVQLGAAILRILEDCAFCDRLVAAAKIDVRARFSWDVVLPQYRQLLNLE
jgi:glycosyltransferase involved in cell wall biosynthesis